MAKPPAQIPEGNSGIWQGISENFAFHASPESFIESRILDFQTKHPDAISSRTPVRAKILNRNVAVISSYRQVKSILEDASSGSDEPAYVACDAYNELMASFFPPPNLLLADGARHKALREVWNARARDTPGDIEDEARGIIQGHLDSLSSGTELDLYESMKGLAWKLLLQLFLGLRPEEAEFGVYQKLHEDLLRGQFSLFPVRVNLGFWHSPRKVGVDARIKLQELILQRLNTAEACSPFNVSDEDVRKDVADHVLLFTSSLAAKGLASLLSALLLNLFVYRDSQGHSLAQGIANCDSKAESRKRLQNILAETERLSPPIVGVMRRCARDNVVEHPTGHSDTLLPKGWDAWLYFVGAGRDPAEFGDSCDAFDALRYEDESLSPPLAFGTGPKTCLGQHIARRLAMIVAEETTKMRLDLIEQELPPGVRGWLGWDSMVGAEKWAADMKQLPTQRPTRPIKVKITR